MQNQATSLPPGIGTMTIITETMLAATPLLLGVDKTESVRPPRKEIQHDASISNLFSRLPTSIRMSTLSRNKPIISSGVIIRIMFHFIPVSKQGAFDSLDSSGRNHI